MLANALYKINHCVLPTIPALIIRGISFKKTLDLYVGNKIIIIKDRQLLKY